MFKWSVKKKIKGENFVTSEDYIKQVLVSKNKRIFFLVGFSYVSLSIHCSLLPCYDKVCGCETDCMA